MGSSSVSRPSIGHERVGQRTRELSLGEAGGNWKAGPVAGSESMGRHGNVGGGTSFVIFAQFLRGCGHDMFDMHIAYYVNQRPVFCIF